MSDQDEDEQGYGYGQLSNTDYTMDLYQKHGLKGLIFVLAFGLHDPSRSLSGALLEMCIPKIIEFTKKRPRLTKISGFLTAFCFLMTFVPRLANEFWLWSRERLYASVAINVNDCSLYGNVMDFIVSKAVFKTRRSLLAQSLHMHKNETNPSQMEYHNRDDSSGDQRVVFKGTSNNMQFFRHHGQAVIPLHEGEKESSS